MNRLVLKKCCKLISRRYFRFRIFLFTLTPENPESKQLNRISKPIFISNPQRHRMKQPMDMQMHTKILDTVVASVPPVSNRDK